MTQMIAGRKYYATPAGYNYTDESGDTRPVYYLTANCPGDSRVPAVPLGGTTNVGGDVRPLYASAPCVDGQLTAGSKVVAVPLGYSYTDENGDTRPVYAFACCPGGSSSSSSSSGSGNICACCPESPLADTLYVTFQPGDSPSYPCPVCDSITGTYVITNGGSGCFWQGGPYDYSNGTFNIAFSCTQANGPILAVVVNDNFFGQIACYGSLETFTCDPPVFNFGPSYSCSGSSVIITE